MEVCGGSGESRQLEGDVQTYSLLCTCDLFKARLGFSIALSVCLSVSVFSLSSCLSLVSHSVFSLSLSLSFYLALIPSVCLSLFQSQFSLSRQRTL